MLLHSFRPAGIVTLCLCATVWNTHCEHAVGVEMADSGVSVASDEQELESVLVATRKSERPAPSDASPSELEPIAAETEHQPELADPEPTLSPPAEQTEDEALESKDNKPAKKQTAKATKPSAKTPASEPEPETSADTKLAKQEPESKPAKFHGVQPGLSTHDDLLREWGAVESSEGESTETPGGLIVSYRMPPFELVEALVQDDLVQIIRVTLARPATNASLIELIGLDQIDPVDVIDHATGDLVGVTFPEKGLTLLTEPSTAPGPTRSSHLVLQPLDSQAFALRAESRPDSACEQKIADLSRAIGLDSTNARAHWQLAGVYHSVGQDGLAEDSADEAVRLAPEDAAYRLRWADCLAKAQLYDQAVLETRQVLDDQTAPEIVRAQALAGLGRLASLGDAGIADKAIGFHTMAIETADRLATSDDDTVRRAAKRLLVTSHLEIAREVARREYSSKMNVVAEWVGRASGFAEEAIESGDGGLELRLLVARDALASLANMRPSKDPSDWVAEAKSTADKLLETSDDPLFRAKVEWELGLAYFYALQTAHHLADAEAALGYGDQAIERLSAGAEPRADSPEARTTVGLLYFAIGAVNAVHKSDHNEAVVWYDKARPIYETMLEHESELVAPRQSGEALVSMAVSYWQAKQRDLALELTTRGAELMEEGVEDRVLAESSLAVPYSNLESMHRRLGDSDQANRFASLARQARAADEDNGATETLDLAPTPRSDRSRTRVAQQNRNQPTAEQSNQPSRRYSTARRPTPRRTLSR